MSPRRSLRGRVVTGSILWAIGLLTLASVLGAVVAHGHQTWIPALHVGLMSFGSLVFIAFGVFLVRHGISPLDTLRERLSALRQGGARRLDGDYPAEVQPLVDDLNALLDDREHRISRALARAGDLAHGLKTPLAVLAHEAERADAAGQPELAAAIRQEVDRMRRQMDYHLANARAAVSGAATTSRSNLAEAARALGRTLDRLHAGRGVTIAADVAPDIAVRVERADLDEMLGNLLDNACKWARARVVVTASPGAGTVLVAIDDDGPGIEASMREAVLQRGVRADEAAAGSGFGLAIVRDLAEVYGGSITLGQSALGGLRAELRLPA